MRIQTEEWQLFTPGVRMYKGKTTLFYNGEIFWDDEERHTWEVIIVLPGVEVIPKWIFSHCSNLKAVIMTDSVRRIENSAIGCCYSLVFVKLSRNLEYIGRSAFWRCESLTSIFIPPSCRGIDDCAFRGCRKLIIFHVAQHTRIGHNVFANTALFEASPFEEVDRSGRYDNHEEVNNWVRGINANIQEYALHRACCSFNNSTIVDVLYPIVRREGLQAFQAPNGIGITPSQYLEANPFRAKDVQTKVINQYVLEMMGEIELV